MKMKFLLSMSVPLLLFYACSKNNQSGNPDTDFTGERLKTVQWTGGGSGTYTYDAQKRQVKEEQNTGITTEFIYNPGKMTRVVKQSAFTDSFKYTLNGEG